MAIRDRIKETKKTLLTLLTKFQEVNRDAYVITKYLDPKLVLFTNKHSRNDAIQELIKLLEKQGKITDSKQFFEAVIQREEIVSTGIGLGVAIPHAKLDEFEDFFIAIAVHESKGIDWKSLDKSLVKVIFLIGGPSNKQTEYLTILSRLTSAVKNETLRQKISEVQSSEELISLLKQYFSKEI